jgi:hypothetical protein
MAQPRIYMSYIIYIYIYALAGRCYIGCFATWMQSVSTIRRILLMCTNLVSSLILRVTGPCMIL